MLFNLKKVFKKVCTLGGALMFLFPLVTPVANATPPGALTYGKRLENFIAYISGENLNIRFDAIEVTAKTNLKYTGTALQLFEGFSYKKDGEQVTVENDGITTYFRVHRKGDPEPSSYTWTNSISTLKGTARGTYELFYYIDGGNEYEDSGSDEPPSQEEGN